MTTARRRRGGPGPGPGTAAAANPQTPTTPTTTTTTTSERGGGNKRKSESKKKTLREEEDDAHADEKDEDETEDEVEEETLWHTFTRHPVVRITVVVLLPYALYHTYLYVVLQRPDLLLPLGIHLRPAVSVRDERQVLIVGSMSSGTTQVSSELKSTFRGLEIGHETSNAQWDFVRDGTVSWFHAIRFFEDDPGKDERESMEFRIKLAVAICGDGKQRRSHYSDLQVMGYHPSMYREPKKRCSYRKSPGDKCWVADCYHKLVEEYGCVHRKDGCETPFRFVLHQVRNPMRTIESLTARFCLTGDDDGGGGDEIDWGGGGADETRGRLYRSFLTFANALCPEHDFSADTSCLAAVAEYVVRYNDVLLAARNRGHVHGMYRIEETNVCDVARMAGLTDEETTVYGPNHDLVEAVCGGGGEGRGLSSEKIGKEKNPINRGRVRLGWKDLRSAASSSDDGGGSALEDRVKRLFHDLGYDPALEEEEVTARDDSSDSLPPPPRHEAKVTGRGEM